MDSLRWFIYTWFESKEMWGPSTHSTVNRNGYTDLNQAYTDKMRVEQYWKYQYHYQVIETNINSIILTPPPTRH